MNSDEKRSFTVTWMAGQLISQDHMRAIDALFRERDALREKRSTTSAHGCHCAEQGLMAQHDPDEYPDCCVTALRAECEQLAEQLAEQRDRARRLGDILIEDYKAACDVLVDAIEKAHPALAAPAQAPALAFGMADLRRLIRDEIVELQIIIESSPSRAGRAFPARLEAFESILFWLDNVEDAHGAQAPAEKSSETEVIDLMQVLKNSLSRRVRTCHCIVDHPGNCGCSCHLPVADEPAPSGEEWICPACGKPWSAEHPCADLGVEPVRPDPSPAQAPTAAPSEIPKWFRGGVNKPLLREFVKLYPEPAADEPAPSKWICPACGKPWSAEHPCADLGVEPVRPDPSPGKEDKRQS
jgi:hypothetical protein